MSSHPLTEPGSPPPAPPRKTLERETATELGGPPPAPRRRTPGGETPTESADRHRIEFATFRSLAHVSVLELGTLWERSLRRARVPVKYSQGYNPRPRMHFAAPLPVGCGSDADLLDISLEIPWASDAIYQALEGMTPPDLAVLNVVPVPDGTSALSEQLVETEYCLWLRGVDRGTVESAVEELLAAESVLLPKRGRRHRGKTYDLRPLIKGLTIRPSPPSPWLELWMRLNAQPGATGRPDEVLKALKLPDVPRRCRRTRLILAETDGNTRTD